MDVPTGSLIAFVTTACAENRVYLLLEKPGAFGSLENRMRLAARAAAL